MSIEDELLLDEGGNRVGGGVLLVDFHGNLLPCGRPELFHQDSEGLLQFDHLLIEDVESHNEHRYTLGRGHR